MFHHGKFKNISKNTRMMKQKDYKTSYERIAVMLLGPLGDVINASCVFSQLKKHYPNAEISIIGSPAGAAAVKGIPEISHIYKYDKKKDNMFKFALSLRNKFDLMVVLDNTLRAGMISFLSGTGKRVGREGDLKKILLTDTIPYLKEEKEMQIPVTEHYSRCLKPLGIYEENLEPHFVYSKEDEQNVEKIFEEYNLKDKKVLGLCTVTYNEEKSLTVEQSAEVIDLIKEKTDYKIIILGGKDAVEYVKRLEAKCSKSFVNLTGKTSFCESACIIDKCSKFISIDTSQMHLAFALRTPAVCLFFTNIFKKWGPRNFEINRLILNMKSKEISADNILKNLNELPDKQSLYS